MGLRERFRRDDEQVDEASEQLDEVTVGEVSIKVGDEQPEPTYTPADAPAVELASPTPPQLPTIDDLDDVVDVDDEGDETVDADAGDVASAASAPVDAIPAPAPPAFQPPAEREALVRPRLAPWQSAALGSNKDVDEDKLFEEAGLNRFERKTAPHLQTPATIAPSAPAAPSAPSASPAPVVASTAAAPTANAVDAVDAASSTATAAATEAAALEADLDDDIDDDDDSDRALARRASKLLERGDLSPDDPEVIHLLEVVNSSGERARPGELVDLNKLDPSERTRLIIRVLCGLVAELPTGESTAVVDDDVPAAEAAATA